MPAWTRAGRSVGLFIAAGLLAACTGGDPDPETGPTDRGDGPTSTAGAGEVVEGGQVRLGVAGPFVVDPARANPAAPAELMVLDLLHDGLTRATADGTLEPALATSWRHGPDHRTWAFELDPEASFASGRPITNRDVVASLERVAAAGDASLAALRLEHVEGFRAFVDGTADRITGLTARADGSVLVSLDRGISTFPFVLAAPEYGVVDPDSLDTVTEGGGDLSALDLSGAWQVRDGDERRLRLERRADRAGHLDGIELRAYDDLAAAYDAFDAGGLDWALVPTERFGEAVERHGTDHFAPFQAELFLGLRVAAPPLDDLALRQAIVAAVDRVGIVEAVYGDRADPLTTIVPAGVAGHDPDRCGAPCAHDPDTARAALLLAHPDGAVPTVHVDFDTSPTQEALARLVAQDLEAVGIPVELRPRSFEDYKRFLVAGGQELFSFGWIGGYAAPDAYLLPLLATGAPDNLAGVAHGGIDRALLAAWNTDDPDEAAAEWARAERRALVDGFVLPLAQFRTQPVVAARVQGLRHGLDGAVDWSAVWVAADGG